MIQYDAVSFIDTRRRNERPHTAAELEWWISSYCHGSVTDYQMAAWLMAVCCHGLTPEETAILTACTVNSGVRLQWDNESDNNNDDTATTTTITTVDEQVESRNLPRRQRRRLPLVDKHSTGGTVICVRLRARARVLTRIQSLKLFTSVCNYYFLPLGELRRRR